MQSSFHKFHIPVMGLGYTIDTPIKVAKYGIDSVMSIVQDDLVERARKYYSQLRNIPFEPIGKQMPEYRSRRITAYLNLVKQLVDQDFEALKSDDEELAKYARLLPGRTTLEDLQSSPNLLRKGSIDVNIMTKLDRQPEGEEVNTEASAAVKGFAESDIEGGLVLSAGLNPRLFAFMEQFPAFFPDINGEIKKRIILKVSDFRSAVLQGKMLAKKGLWVSEYRIESGLNCGGHTFATDGLLMGPILEDFKSNRQNVAEEQFAICKEYWEAKGYEVPTDSFQKITVQGGIGTAAERQMLEYNYGVDATGWGSPFLLVPEATSIDDDTLQRLVLAEEKDIYNSPASPLGVAFSNLRTSEAEVVKNQRIREQKTGNQCYRKHLALNGEYKETGLCTASVTYQNKKIKELQGANLSEEAYQKAYNELTAKECLCDGLSVSFYKKFGLLDNTTVSPVSVCPGPNLAYFDSTYTLEEMVGHIYGRNQVLNKKRPHVFIKELQLYMDHFDGLVSDLAENHDRKMEKKVNAFRENMIAGVQYYREIMSEMVEDWHEVSDYLAECEARLEESLTPEFA